MRTYVKRVLDQLLGGSAALQENRAARARRRRKIRRAALHELKRQNRRTMIVGGPRSTSVWSIAA